MIICQELTISVQDLKYPRSLPNICKEKPMIRHAWKASTEVIVWMIENFIFVMIIRIMMLGNDQNCVDFLRHDDDCDDCQDEEKFQREILSDEPNLIKLYLQVENI